MTIQYPQSKSLTDQIVELIENQIINGEYNVGDKLPTENELAAMYKVSRTVIREAIKILKQKGWVETFVAKGTFVVHNTIKGVQFSFDTAMRMQPEERFGYLIEVRLILEPEIAALAALRANKEEIAKMKQAVKLMDKALTDANKIDEFLNGDFTFHMTMAESTSNPLIHLILNPVVSLLRDVQEYHLFNVKGGDQKSQHHHRLIMNAIERHDPSEARLQMHNHIIQLRTDIEKQKAAESVTNKLNPAADTLSG
jgi:GntR family transcriptional repressor for pyruvate dehydrogenase complex